ncbi:MAG: hypothetical protein ACPIOQ_13030, partial [Promethearchaeia archaeon]
MRTVEKTAGYTSRQIAHGPGAACASTSRHASAEHERLVVKMDTHAPSAVDATHGGTASPQVSRLLMPDLLHGLERRRRGAGSNGKFVPPVEGAQMAAQRRAKARTAARKMDAAHKNTHPSAHDLALRAQS